MGKVKVSQDFLYAYLEENGINISRIAERMGVSNTTLSMSFRHSLNRHGKPMNLSASNIERLNVALSEMSLQMQQSRIVFGSPQTYTNSWGNTYDPAAVDSIKKLCKFFKIMPFLESTLGWTKGRSHIVLNAPSSKGYACVSADDVRRINDTMQKISILLGSIEVEIPDSSSSTSSL